MDTGEGPGDGNAQRFPVRRLPVEDLVVDPNLNLRDRLDDEAVQRYVDAFDRLPPLTVFEVEGRWLVADGFHRHAAAVILSKREISAEVRPGTYQDALEFAASSNHHHGLPLTRGERRRAIEIKLKLHPDWSDRRLAEELGAGRETIAKIRRELAGSGEIPGAAARVGADGKLYPVGLPKDPYETLPRGPAIAQQDDPSDRVVQAPWDSGEDPMPGGAKSSKTSAAAASPKPRSSASDSTAPAERESGPLSQPSASPATSGEMLAPWEGEDAFADGATSSVASAPSFPSFSTDAANSDPMSLQGLVQQLQTIEARLYDEDFEALFRAGDDDLKQSLRRILASIAARGKLLAKL